ncbi:hypothetical protein D3C74_186070 [compost metagenome]
MASRETKIGIQQPQPNKRDRNDRNDRRQIKDCAKERFPFDVLIKKNRQEERINDTGRHTKDNVIKSNSQRFIKISVFAAEHSLVVVEPDKGRRIRSGIVGKAHVQAVKHRPERKDQQAQNSGKSKQPAVKLSAIYTAFSLHTVPGMGRDGFHNKSPSVETLPKTGTAVCSCGTGFPNKRSLFQIGALYKRLHFHFNFFHGLFSRFLA